LDSLRISGVRPQSFHGKIILPPSKSYAHRALFSAALLNGKKSTLHNVGEVLSDDIKATISFLEHIGITVNPIGSNSVEVSAPQAYSTSSNHSVDLRGSGTTARFAIAVSALISRGDKIRLTGNSSLRKRPMQPLLDGLSQLGVKNYSDHGHLPVTIFGGGLNGGDCIVDGSISSQFISALIIASLRARQDTKIIIRDRSKMVSEPYIDATIRVLEHYGFVVNVLRRGSTAVYKIRCGQKGRNRNFAIPGDMSSAAALIGATITSSGSLKLVGSNLKLPQPDSEMLHIAKELGAQVQQQNATIFVDAHKVSVMKKKKNKKIIFNLVNSPDLVPAVFGTSSGIGIGVKIENIGHLRFKESDRIHTLAHQFSRLGLRIAETRDSISLLNFSVNKSRGGRRSIFLHPQDDHRMLMAYVIAGLSGRFGELYVRNPDCVNKSYPNFVRDIRSLLGNERDILKIVKKDSK
jgi:3-phosphoshikimate 1-carboxyvinyltransferase